MTSLEIDALTNSVIASHALFLAYIMLSAKRWFPGLHPVLVRAGKCACLSSFAFVIHRVYWNFAIWGSSVAEHGLNSCTPPGAEKAVDFCFRAWWAPHYAHHLFWPVIAGMIGVAVAMHLIRPGKSGGRVIALYVAVLVLPAMFWVYVA